MAEILEFKPKHEAPPEDAALVCTCGCMTWLLLGDGNIECAGCHFVLPANWGFDEEGRHI